MVFKIKTNRYYYSCLMALSLFFLNSCHEKGCTDRNALNYNSVADVDDGSCIICKTQTDTSGTIADELVDDYYSSPHYGEQVAIFHLFQLKEKYSYSECGETNCYYIIKIESNVNSKMTFSYNLNTYGDVNLYMVRNVVVLPKGTYYSEKITSNASTPCGSLQSSTLYVYRNGVITYN